MPCAMHCADMGFILSHVAETIPILQMMTLKVKYLSDLIKFADLIGDNTRMWNDAVDLLSLYA